MERLSSTALAVANSIARMNGDLADLEAAFRALAIAGAPSDGIELSVLARQHEVTAQQVARAEESVAMCRTALARLRRALESRPTTVASPSRCPPSREGPPRPDEDGESDTVWLVWPRGMHNGGPTA